MPGNVIKPKLVLKEIENYWFLKSNNKVKLFPGQAPQSNTEKPCLERTKQ